MLVRSPTLTNNESSSMTSGSRPARARRGWSSGLVRGLALRARWQRARICSGVVPQQPPTRLTRPRSMKSPRVSAISSGVSSYSPNSLGRPAFGCTLTKVVATLATASTWGRRASAPRAQFKPTINGSAWRIECQNASGVCPDSVRPLASVMVPDTITGNRCPRSSNTSSKAYSAALAFKVSNTVSIMMRSTPPATSPRAASAYASTSSGNRIFRAPGSFTSGEMLADRLVGPMTPATHLGCPGTLNSSAVRRAMSAAATFIS